MAVYKGVGYDTSNAKVRTGTSSDSIQFAAEIDAQDGVSVTGAISATTLTTTGDASVGGNLDVAGDIISRGAVNLVVSDDFIDLNFANSTTTAQAGGLTVTMNRTTGFTAGTITTFVAGVASTSNPTFTYTDAGSSSLLVANDVVIIDGADDSENNGIYVVSSVNQASFPQVVTIKGVGTTSTSGSTPWAQTQFTAATGDTATGFCVDLSVWCVADGTGSFNDASGSAYSKGTFVTAYATDAAEGDFTANGSYTTAASTMQSAYDGGATITTASSTDIALTLTSGSFTATGAGAVSLTPTSASTFTSGGALTFTAGAASTWSTSAGALVIDGGGGLTLDSDGTDAVNLGTEAAAKTITIGNAASTKVDVNALAIELDSAGTVVLDSTTTTVIGATTTMDLDAAGILSINSSAAAINMGNDDVDQNINIGTQGERTVSISTGAFASTLALGNVTGATAVTLKGGTGGIDIDCGGATGALALDTAGGAIEIGVNAAAGAINIGTNATAREITIGPASAADASGLTLRANTGGIDIDCGQATGVLALDTAGGAIEIGVNAAAGNISVGTNGTARTITVGNAIGATALNVDAGTGGITIDTTDGGAISIDAIGAPSNLTLTSTAAADDLTIALAGATDSSLVLSSTGTGADALQITASAGGIDIAASGAAAGEDIDITATGSSVNITSTEADAAAIKLNASNAAGGIDIDCGTGGLNALVTGNGDINIISGAASTSTGLSVFGGSFPMLAKRWVAGLGGLSVGDTVYGIWDAGNSRLEATVSDADAIATSRFLGVCISAASAGSDATIAMSGVVKNVTSDTSITAASHVGFPVYLSTTAGKITPSAPTGAGDVIFQVGICVGGSTTAWEVMLQPQMIMEIG